MNQSLKELSQEIASQEEQLRQGGGEAGRQRQKKLGRMVVRERLERLLDPDTPFFELGLWAAFGMYKEWGALPAAGLVAGVGRVNGRDAMVIANDATVKAGAMFPQSIKKLLRAQRIAFEARLPIVYLVDSSGVFLPLQDEIFPDEDDFGRIFRNNSVLSAAGIPQIAAVMGNCIAGGAYLPVLCDKLLMTEGSGLYLAGPALVKAAIGQIANTEELGGARMHAEISGTVDFCEPNDESCLQRIRSLVSSLPESPSPPALSDPESDTQSLYELVSADGRKEYDVRDVLRAVVDAGSLEEYKAGYGQTVVTGYAKVGGYPVGVVANQRVRVRSTKGGIEIGGVIYTESADKAARFVMDCNQIRVPLVFLQDVVGFMVGREAEQSGIIRAGAKLVNAVSNTVVPKITIVLGNSFGAGNYAMCGKAYDPNFILAWPGARYAVMGAEQAAQTLMTIQSRGQKGQTEAEEDQAALYEKTKAHYEEQMDIRYGAARGWVDAIIQPHETRAVLGRLVGILSRAPLRTPTFHTGVLQV